MAERKKRSQTNKKLSGIKVVPRKGVRENPDGSVSTHLMRRELVPGRGWVVFPSLFQNEKDEWVDFNELFGDNFVPALHVADQKGESIDFGEDEKAAINFADRGIWKAVEQISRRKRSDTQKGKR